MEPLRVGGTIKPPVKTRDVKPVYPPDAQMAGVQGVVIVQATIDTIGRVHSASVIKSIPLLDEAALTAVRQWEFQPVLVNGLPTPVVMTVTVNFVVQQ
jgi:protein TonB